MILFTRTWKVTKLQSGQKMVSVLVSNLSKDILKITRQKVQAAGGTNIRLVVETLGIEVMLQKATFYDMEFKRAGAYIQFRCDALSTVPPVTSVRRLRMW
jgi:hypothetical protein